MGSFGIADEARMIAFAVGRQLKLAEVKGLDLNKSAGPATVIIATVDREHLEDLTSLISKPVSVVGEIL